MSYQVLARKWRPSNFSEVAGQAHVLKSLINALDNERLHHAYLFTGTRGVGKTTLARILAKCLNCEEGVSSVPCGKCDSCKEINEGRFIDLIEVDAASRTKVEDTRELLDNVQYAPSRGRFKVYLIDEVHMLSNHSFNALLKTLEEPPPHVKFLFATTDPQKLPITILSRCLQFNLKNLSPQLITEYLGSVLEKESLEFEDEALWQIAAAASGSMRDALTLVDQAISYCEGRVATDGVIEMLGVPPQKQVYELLKAMASRSVSTVLELIRYIAEQTPDYSHTLDSLLSTLHRVAIAQIEPKAVDNSYGDMPQILELSSLISAEDVQLYYQMGIKGREDLRLSAEVRTAFEMLLIRMLVFSPSYVEPKEILSLDANSESPSDTVAESGAAAESKKKKNRVEPNQEPGTEALESSVDVAAEEERESSANEQAMGSVESSAKPASNSVDVQSDSAGSAVKFRLDAQHAAVETPEKISLDSLNKQSWLRVYPQLEISGIAANVLANSDFHLASSNSIHFVLDHSQSAVFSEELLPKISRALSDYFSSELSVNIEIGETKNETPALLSQRLKEEQHAAMINNFEKDENVQELLKHFSGTLARESIAPHKD
ncbi:MAG: DNA polymerase III subunit gamma/tau [Gammaproteobacteria bacterium]|nr:DNA polymerase III subunit gamma/tau [Gammaproteobacteria bacterium]MDG2338205.1 DNA polymerase III subunit gamma/tau [Gammaproteobacteria bacterium]